MDDSRFSTEAQARSGGWLAAYLDLKAHGLHWKKAAFCAWFSASKSARLPKTLEDLAELLNYKSSWVFHKWKKQAWFRELGIDRLRESILLQHLADVDRRTIEAALTGTVADRRLFYEQIREARPDIEADVSIDVTFKRALDKAYRIYDSDEDSDETE